MLDKQTRLAYIKEAAIHMREDKLRARALYEEDNELREAMFGADARILSGIVEWYKSHKFLSPKQLATVRERMLKYSGQLANIANRKGN